MQCHQSALSQENHKNKILCHKRRPSIGKSMPVTALLLNYPPPSKGYEKLGTDGLLPEEIERPPLYFQVDELNNDAKIEDFNLSENEITIDDNTYKIIDYDKRIVNSQEFFKGSEQKTISSETNLNDIILCGNLNSNSVPNCGECTKITSCGRNMLYNKPSPLKDLCAKLCNNDCKLAAKIHDMEDITTKTNTTIIKKKNNTINSPRLVMKSLLKVPSKLDLERKKFLDEILKDVKLDKIAGIDFDNDEDDDVNKSSESNNNEQLNKNDELNKKQKLNDQNYTDEVRNENTILLDKSSFHEKFKIADALARTSMMTSPAAKRRLAARKIEMELDFGRINSDLTTTTTTTKDFVPPRDLLLYLVRMGSFNSAPKINNSDTQDDHLIIPNGLNSVDLIKHCKALRGENRPQLLKRNFLNPAITNERFYTNELSEGLRFLNIANSVPQTEICSTLDSSSNHIRVLQWNILSQSLGQNNDGFVCCPDEALTWEHRKFLLIEEILQNDPDIICLQEVDHFKFLEKILGSQNYTGIFFPKPDSPCLYIEENNGPDGCAIFYKRDKFDLINYDTRILEVWHVQSNQVAIIANLKLKNTEKELTVCTTHLKARNGALLSKLRNEQGKDLLKFVSEASERRPILLCGDFNAEPIEPVYSTVLNNKELELSSAYAEINKEMEESNDDYKMKKSIDVVDDANKENIENQCNVEAEYDIAEIMSKREPAYTTWKIREEGEVCHTIDYIFYSKNFLKVRNCLNFPESDEIGKDRTPSFRYPSDHFSLVCDFEFTEEEDSVRTSASPNSNNPDHFNSSNLTSDKS